MIFGLVAALGWGLADFGGAVSGRRIGSLADGPDRAGAVAPLVMTVLLFAGGHDPA